jgi:hypothetical protein
MSDIDKERWIFEDAFDDAGLSLTERLFLFYLKETTKPDGLVINWRWITTSFPEVLDIRVRLSELAREGKIYEYLRILPKGVWWFPGRCREVLGAYFYPKVKKQRETLISFLQYGVPLAEVPDFYWGGLEKLPQQQVPTSKDALIRLVNSLQNTPSV